MCCAAASTLGFDRYHDIAYEHEDFPTYDAVQPSVNLSISLLYVVRTLTALHIGSTLGTSLSSEILGNVESTMCGTNLNIQKEKYSHYSQTILPKTLIFRN